MPSGVLTPTGATYSLPSGTTEQTAFTISSTQNNVVKGIWLDLTALTQNITIRVQYRQDGTNFRTFQTISWTTGMEDMVLVEGDIPINNHLRVTLQSAVAEGASRNIPYQYWTDGLGSGAITFTYTVTDSVSGLPLAGVDVWVTTDATGNNVVATGTTSSIGVVVFYLDAATYFFWRDLAGYNFTNPDTEVVS